MEIPDGKDSKVTELGLADGEISTASDGLYFGHNPARPRRDRHHIINLRDNNQSTNRSILLGVGCLSRMRNDIFAGSS